MRSPSSPSRTSGLAAAATTVLALVAATASATSGRATAAACLEGRQALTEAQAVRALAAAVVRRVARDMLGDERPTLALPYADPVADPVPDVIALRAAVDADDATPACRPLAERLLDLPPPTC